MSMSDKLSPREDDMNISKEALGIFIIAAGIWVLVLFGVDLIS